MELLQGAGGFVRLRDGARGIAVRRALQQVLQRFRQLAAALQPLLSQRDMVAVASLVLSGSCSKMAGGWPRCIACRTTSIVPPIHKPTYAAADDTVAMHHIAADEAEDLARILEPFLEAAPGALVGTAAEAGTLPAEHLQASLRWRTRAYRRLQVDIIGYLQRLRHTNRTGNPGAAACVAVRDCSCLGAGLLAGGSTHGG